MAGCCTGVTGAGRKAVVAGRGRGLAAETVAVFPLPIPFGLFAPRAGV
jgi:hypothetical protein